MGNIDQQQKMEGTQLNSKEHSKLVGFGSKEHALYKGEKKKFKGHKTLDNDKRKTSILGGTIKYC